MLNHINLFSENGLKMEIIIILILFIFQSGIYLYAGKEENLFIQNIKVDKKYDITKSYLIENESNWIHNHLNELKNYKIIFLPGYLSKEINSLYDYFDDQMKYLVEAGIENEKLNLSSAKGIEVNADIIIEKLNLEKKELIIISHSKGGLDFLNALIKSSKKKNLSWLKKIKGWLAIQSPFYGSPVADDMSIIKIFTKGVIRLFDGEYQSLEDLMIKNRKKYMKENEKEIDFWLSNMTVITLSTYILPAKFKNFIHYLFLGGQNTILAGIRDYYYKKQIYMDGLVPYQSAILPNTDYILLENVDHLSTVSKNKFNEFDRILFLNKSLSLLFKKNK